MKSYTLDYSSYINENNSSENKEFVLSILKNYLETIESAPLNIPIFRGLNKEYAKFSVEVESEHDLFYFEPRESRKSLTSNTGEYDTLWNIWFANNEIWKEYPSRKFRANICSTSANYADQYGLIYLIIPAEDSKFGLCPSEDIFSSFRKSKFSNSFENQDISTFTEFLDDVFYFICNTKEIESKVLIESKDYKEILKKFSKIDLYFSEIRNEIDINNKDVIYDYITNINDEISGGDDLYASGIEFILKSNNTLFEIVEEFFNPKLNNIQLFSGFSEFLENANVSKDSNANNYGQEMWFNGNYLAIDLKEDMDLMKNIILYKSLHIEFIKELISNLETIQ